VMLHSTMEQNRPMMKARQLIAVLPA